MDYNKVYYKIAFVFQEDSIVEQRAMIKSILLCIIGRHNSSHIKNNNSVSMAARVWRHYVIKQASANVYHPK